jgi:glycosyltransferase involved in cell wall biosynthesis
MQPENIPSPWIVADMTALAAIEPELFPDPHDRGRFLRPYFASSNATSLLFELLGTMHRAEPEVVLLAPWIRPGGAELTLLNHAKAAMAMGVSCLIITTEPHSPAWPARMPAGVGLVDFGSLAGHLSGDEQRVVLAQFLIHCGTRVVQIVNSMLGWEVVRLHGKALKQVGIKLVANLFCDEADALGRRMGYATNSFPQCSIHLDAVLTDSRQFADMVHFRDGYDRARLIPMNCPVNISSRSPRTGEGAGSNHKILWASRIARQKNPDILLEIVQRCPELSFHIHGEADETVTPAVMKALESAPNVMLRGAFASFDDVCNEEEYAAFLYTSAWDGMPNVILEAAANGLPIVAPDVGGIAELIGDDAGYLVADCQNPEEYVEKLDLVFACPATAVRRAARAASLVESRHSFDAFVKSHGQIPGYLRS